MLSACRLAWWNRLLAPIDALGPQLEPLSDDALRKRALALRYRAKSGEPLERLLVECYALVREAAGRKLGLRHYTVQLLGGIALHHRAVAEMQTGEGKTLTATLPLTLAALTGRGAHLATANDYLARRDAELLAPVYQALGLSTGLIQQHQLPAERRAAYACDITYATASELGFDFLRDRLLAHAQRAGGGLAATTTEQPLQRGRHFVLVDEADSVLIDDAGTPLVISAAQDASPAEQAAFAWSAQVAARFQPDEHFRVDGPHRQVQLTEHGRRLARSLSQPAALRELTATTMFQYVQRAIHVERHLQRDRHYVLADDEVQIVDENTGRVAEGRRWRNGLHQAVEAKEGLAVRKGQGSAARITVQDFFRGYERMAGMTGTAATSDRELKNIFGLRVASIPTNRPPIRQQLPTRVLATAEEKWQAVVEEVVERRAAGQSVLVGTRSIDKSERISQLLRAAGVAHQVLNARRIAEEAAIIAAAGQPQRVTVATNMAGRGTDIQLSEAARAAGGLHVICTDLHDSARIDRQLIGRCGRQGDPGTWRQFLALDDDILTSGLGQAFAERLQCAAASSSGQNLKRYEHHFRRAQRRLERRAFKARRVLLYLEQRRQEAHRQMGRDPLLEGAG